VTDTSQRAPAPGSSGPPARIRVIGQAITGLVARFPFLWRFLRGPTRRFFDRMAPDWNQRAATTPERMAPLEAALGALESEPERIVDLGTGTGSAAIWLARRFPDAEVVGLDLSPAMIETARANLDPQLSGRVRYEVADADRVPPELGTFDLVVQLNVPAFFAGIARVLRPGGHVIAVSTLGATTPFYTPTALLERGFAKHGIVKVAAGSAGPGTYFVASAAR
jgi:SAM-dependent methyltransferase